MKLEIPIIILLSVAILLTIANVYNTAWEQYNLCKWMCYMIIYLLCVHVYDGVGDLIREIKELKYHNRILEDKIDAYKEYVERVGKNGN